MTATAAYKFLGRGAVAPFSKQVWPKPSGRTPGAWVEAALPLEACRSGIHVCRPVDLAYWLNTELWEVEVDGARDSAINGVVVQRARLIRQIDGWSDASAERFRAMTAEHALTLASAASPDARASAIELIEGFRPAHVCPLATAAYVFAVAASKLAQGDAAVIAAFHAERAWQSLAIADALRLTSN